jgi:hypothetical protein
VLVIGPLYARCRVSLIADSDALIIPLVVGVVVWRVASHVLNEHWREIRETLRREKEGGFVSRVEHLIDLFNRAISSTARSASVMEMWVLSM